MKRFLFMIALIAISGSLFAQDIQVNRQNKTIAVTADDSVTADAEIAVLEIGYHNYAPTQDGAFYENVRVAEQITKAFLDAKIPKANIETQKLRLTRTEIDEKWTADMKKDRQFTAEQSWHVTVSATQAHAVVDLAVKAGANELDDVQWNVADPVALQAKAGSAALTKARAVADQMAKGLGTKLGELVYASNRAPTAKMYRGMETAEVMAPPPPPPPPPKLTLFPQKVKSDATVYAVFSIE
ncbi:MAG: SIMPL domain-containing protein [Terriglobales bacterium]